MSRVGRRYAKAIFALAEDEKEIEAVGAEIAAVARLFEDPAIAAALASPLLSVDRRRSLVESMRRQIEPRPMVAHLLLLLADRGRLDQIPAIADSYQRLEDQALGRVRVHIRTAFALTDAERKKVVDTFSRSLGREVIARVEVDAALLGGLVVEAEGVAYDGSVRTQLQHLARKIAHTETQL